MGIQCEVLRVNQILLRAAMARYLKDKDKTAFMNRFIKKSSTPSRIDKRPEDTTTNMEDVNKDFINMFDILARSISGTAKDGSQAIAAFNDLRESVTSVLFNRLDNSAEGKIGDQESDSDSTPDEESKTLMESLDKNRAKLDEHLKEFYGEGSYNIINNLYDTFEDSVTSAAYWDGTTGAIVAYNNVILNTRIQEFKNRLYKQIVQFLKQKGKLSEKASESMVTSEEKFIGHEYFNTLETFYEYFKELPNAKEQLVEENKNRINNTFRKEKEARYIALVKALKNMPNESTRKQFLTRMKNAFGQGKRSLMAESQLFTADSYSDYFKVVNKAIRDFGLQNVEITYSENGVIKTQTVQEALDFIGSTETSLLNAANAYTSLTHFDKILKARITSITVDKDFEDQEVAYMDKYAHHQDTSHEKKGWQTSESVDSEKYTANLTKALFRQIKIYNFKTNQYTGKRLDSTAFIVATHNLIDDIVYGRIQFNGAKEDVEKLLKCIVELHDNPVRNFQRILELLFDNGANNLIDKMKYNYTGVKKLLSDSDKNILFSIYNAVFNKNNPVSLISSELQHSKELNGPTLSLIGEVAGYVDRNASMHYSETSIDYDSGEVKIVVKRKFSNNISLKKTIDTINNSANTRTQTEIDRIQNDYKLEYTKANLAGTMYSVNIGGQKFVLNTSSIGSKIMNGESQNFDVDTKEILKRLDKIDLIDFRNAILRSGTLNEDEQLLRDVLDFLEDTLGIKFETDLDFNLQALQIFKEIYDPNDYERGVKGNHSPSNNYSGYLEPLIKLGIRAAYVNARIAEAKAANKTLKDYLESLTDDDGIYKTFLDNRKTSRIFSERWNDVQYRITSRNDEVLSVWEDAKAMLTGQASKATTKDKQGNNIPNNSVNKLGNLIYYYVNKQKDTNVGSLMFAENRNLIRSVYHDLEVTAQNGESKSIRNFSSGELFFHALFNKFWGNYLTNGSVIIQPTTYSDKTTFINYDISTKFLDQDKDILGIEYDDPYKYQTAVIAKYGETIGEMYKQVWTATRQKLEIIAAKYNEEQTALLNKEVNLGYKEVLRKHSEKDLIALAQRAGVTLELDKDYRIITENKQKVCTYNEMLEYNAEILYATNVDGEYANLRDYLREQRKVFISNLIQANSSFQVVDFNDNYDNYIEGKLEEVKSKNAVMSTILRYFKQDTEHGIEKRQQFFKNWVDSETGRLILAKKHDGTTIIGIGDNYNNEDVVLNPFLDKFFYVEGLLSNNIRMSLTGTEINHPDKAKKTAYNLIKDADLTNDNTVAIIRQSLNDDNISIYDLSQLQSLLDNTATVSDMYSSKLRSEADKLGIVDLFDKVYHKTILDITNTAQGTQFKRNVIIPATLQYLRQKAINGVPPKIKCAVIRDEKAPVNNYRGETDEIDAADGSAQINPFQSILENRCLDSQAVGFTKKPIWHAYDTESGTAFLAKFATDTITNEAMRASVKSHSNLYRLFKKMTNLQWQGDVDLTRGISIQANASNNAIKTWFQTKILGNSEVNGEFVGNQRLIYQDSYGDKIEILSLQADKTDKYGNLYYTVETDFSAKPLNNPTIKNVYHVFANVNGVKSKHFTFDTRQAAIKFIEDIQQGKIEGYSNAHTINSLYELHTALGGINCINSKGEFSEFNNEVVVNYMNEIGSRREGYKPTDLKDQDSYYQPLKQYHIGYALNNSAVKNGAKNINQKEAWSNDDELSYFEVDSDGLGMQMNADHDIINSELTEFSQVITATSAYGYTYENSNEIFTSLGMAAFKASEKALRAVNQFIEDIDTVYREQALSDLYDAVGRIIMVNQSIKDRESLQGVIMQAVQKIFYNSKNHLKDAAKIPFSDANIYSEFIATLASTINKESIKRKHPGSGCVMVPGYNTMQYFEVDGQKMMADDVLREARKDYKQELIKMLSIDALQFDPKNGGSIIIQKGENQDKYYLNTTSLKKLESLIVDAKLENTSGYFTTLQDTSERELHMIENYLSKKQINAPVYDDNSWFMPSDIVDLVASDGKVTTIDLNSMQTYYDYKGGVIEAQIEHNVKIKSDYQKGKYTISLNEDSEQQFIVEAEVIDGVNTGKYNIHFRTGERNEILKRRIIGNKPLTDDQKTRLFKAALQVLPIGATLRLSPTTAKEINSGLGGLTPGSIAGYNSLINPDRQNGTTLQTIGEPYEVTYFDVQGRPQITMVSEYKKVAQTSNFKHRVNVTRPHNLRPSLIRWQYKDDTGIIRYKNIFDTEVIRRSFTNPGAQGKDYRNQIQNILHSLEENGVVEGYQVIEGSIENTAAELIMSNIYQDKFDIKDESLQEILEQGEQYFIKKAGKELRPPQGNYYDIAFLSETGDSTLISLNHVRTGEDIYEVGFDNSQLMTNEKDEIVLMKGNRELFEVGRWANASNVIYRDGKFYRGTQELNQDDYRLKNPDDTTSVQKKIMYVKQYKVISKVTKKKEDRYIKHTLYQLADIPTFVEGMKDLEAKNGEPLVISASKQRASIINKIYGNHKAIYVNGQKAWKQFSDNSSELDRVEDALSFIRGSKKKMKDGSTVLVGGNRYISKDVRDLLNIQLEHLRDSVVKPFDKNATEEEKKAAFKAQQERAKANKEAWIKAQNDFMLKDAHRKWVSFQDSTNFIASRIPAQTLQSFMSMKLVAWTKNSKNMAYVSHFQTYLQGSDYDIDKAYIMGQSYNNSANYISWSNLFDFTSYETLQASKELPIPKGAVWEEAARKFKETNPVAYREATQVSIDSSETDVNVEDWITLTNGDMNNLVDISSKVKAIKLLAKIIRNVEKNNRKLKYAGSNIDAAKKLLDLINNHEHTPLHPSIAEAAYKNVASANIYAVAHSIRNRDQAYTAITMAALQRAAANSPKGNQAGSLNMLNPLTKYIMQYQNLVGKNVISVAANGEKVWFNAFYYWTKILKSGDIDAINRLKFQQTFKRIAGRANKNIEEKTVKSLPDLNYRDEVIKAQLLNSIGITEQDMEYVYVDQLISQLLSAATDNAKELILAKINSGTNFARMYVYAIMTGFNIDDIVAFMTSPVAEFIDQMSASNMFQNDNTFNSPATAISLAEGYINPKRFLHGKYKTKGENSEGGEETVFQNKDKFILEQFANLDDNIIQELKKQAELEEDEDFTDLGTAMKALINIGISNPYINIMNDLDIVVDDTEINTYLMYCQNVISQLRKVYGQYSTPEETIEDITEFKKLYELASEISTIATAYLSSNQGLPTDELGIIKKLSAMAKLVSTRERQLDIRDGSSMYNITPKTITEEEEDVTIKKRQGRSAEKREESKRAVAIKILENNPTLGEGEDAISSVIQRLDDAYDAGVLGNFDTTRYLNEPEYRAAAIDYYGLLMGTLNVFDMMENIPTYSTILDCMKLLINSNNLSAKSRFINKLLYRKDNVSDQELKGLINFADQLITFNFTKSLPIINLEQETEGFDDYFANIKVSQIDLSTLNGIATFRKWVEQDFFDYLKKNYRKNGAVKHLTRLTNGDQTNIAMDIDVLNPNVSSQSELAFDEILRGMAELDNLKNEYGKSGLSIADILQLYNIIVYNNQYGAERLTTTFQVCKNPNNILNRYLKYISNIDIDGILDNTIMEHNNIDYLIASAPLISEFAERTHKEPFVKTRDDVRGFILKKLNDSNQYVEYDLVPISSGESDNDKYQRIKNFMIYSPMLFIDTHNKSVKTRSLVFEDIYGDNPSEANLIEAEQMIYKMLQQYSITGKLKIFKDCY